jgi:hypothetical protein
MEILSNKQPENVIVQSLFIETPNKKPIIRTSKN